LPELFHRFISCHCWLLCDWRPLEPLPLGLLRPPSPPLPPPCLRPGPLLSLLLLALHVLFLLDATLDPEDTGYSTISDMRQYASLSRQNNRVFPKSLRNFALIHFFLQ
jgi:hypothetical protein